LTGETLENHKKPHSEQLVPQLRFELSPPEYKLEASPLEEISTVLHCYVTRKSLILTKIV
jgi:hypothetical protein